MEPDTNESHDIKPNSLNTVTPLSKYLAMILFILMPFIGGWIGYQYGAEKIVEIEKVTGVEELANQETNNNTYSEDLRVGDMVAGMRVASIEPFRSEVCIDESCVEKREYPLDLFKNSIVTFTGEKILNGTILMGDGIFSGVPFFSLHNPVDLPYGPESGKSNAISHAISQEAYDYYGEGSHEITIDRYVINSYPSAVVNRLNVVLPTERNIIPESWLEYESPQANIKFKHPPEYVVTNHLRPIEFCKDNPACYRKGEQLITMVHESRLDSEKGTPSLTIMVFEEYNGPFTDLVLASLPSEEYSGKLVPFEDYDSAIEKNEPGYVYINASKHTTINDLEALLYRQSGLSMFGQLYNAHFLLPDGRAVVFTSELDNEMLEGVYQSVSLIE